MRALVAAIGGNELGATHRNAHTAEVVPSGTAGFTLDPARVFAVWFQAKVGGTFLHVVIGTTTPLPFGLVLCCCCAVLLLFLLTSRVVVITIRVVVVAVVPMVVVRLTLPTGSKQQLLRAALSPAAFGR